MDFQFEHAVHLRSNAPAMQNLNPLLKPRHVQVVPKGHWRLAGGANNRFVVKIESEPRRGLPKSREDHSVAPAGARRI